MTPAVGQHIVRQTGEPVEFYEVSRNWLLSRCVFSSSAHYQGERRDRERILPVGWPSYQCLPFRVRSDGGLASSSPYCPCPWLTVTNVIIFFIQPQFRGGASTWLWHYCMILWAISETWVLRILLLEGATSCRTWCVYSCHYFSVLVVFTLILISFWRLLRQLEAIPTSCLNASVQALWGPNFLLNGC